MRGRKTAANCESCMNYEYDDDYECYVCTQDLDEDEMVRFVQEISESAHIIRWGMNTGW